MRVYTHAEVCSEEHAIEDAVACVLPGGQDSIVHCWGYTLHHIEELPTTNYGPPERWFTPGLSFGQFKKDMMGCKIRKAGQEWRSTCPDGDGRPMQPKPELPASAWGEVPPLQALGFSPEDEALVRALSCDARAAFSWKGGETWALARLHALVWERDGLKGFISTTDWSVSAKCDETGEQTSKLSPYLAFGCVSPRVIYEQILRYEASQGGRSKGARGFMNSLLWRDFYRFMVHFAWGDRLFHLFGPMSCGSEPGGHRIPQKWCCFHYNNIFGGSDPRMWTWGKDREKLSKWTEGRTGYPFVDASMLELRHTGFLRHLTRETVCWFFVRDLQLDWRLGAEWFESCLVDYDCVLNWGNWAYFVLTQIPSREDDRRGGGPRYRIPLYSPYLLTSQVLEWGSEHDPLARHVYRWLPQLAGLPPVLGREPWRLIDESEDGEDLGALLASLEGEEAGWVGWSCAACTLENPARRTACEACGTRRPRVVAGGSEGKSRQGADPVLAGLLGVYAEKPIVPPPPGAQQFGDCAECGRANVVGVGTAELDGDGDVFYCGRCWLTWASRDPEVGSDTLPALLAARGDPKKGWTLVPSHALPRAVQQAPEDDMPLPEVQEPLSPARSAGGDSAPSPERRAGRWKRQGEIACGREGASRGGARGPS